MKSPNLDTNIFFNSTYPPLFNAVFGFLAAVALTSILPSGKAQPLPPGSAIKTIVFDERGNGVVIADVPTGSSGQTDVEGFEIPPGLDSKYQPPSTPGLSYDMSADFLSATPGDVVLISPGGAMSDVIRFRGDGTVAFYSMPNEGDGLADHSASPLPLQGNAVFLSETYPLPDLGAKYTPTQGQPGWFSEMNGKPYYFISDTPWPRGSIPEGKVRALNVDFPDSGPTSILLGASVLGFLGYARRSRTMLGR